MKFLEKTSLRVLLVVGCPKCNCTVNILIVSDKKRGYAFLNVLLKLTKTNYGPVQTVWEALCDKLAQEAGSGAKRGPGRRLKIMPKKGTTLVEVVNALKDSGFNVRSCVI